MPFLPRIYLNIFFWYLNDILQNGTGESGASCKEEKTQFEGYYNSSEKKMKSRTSVAQEEESKVEERSKMCESKNEDDLKNKKCRMIQGSVASVNTSVRQRKYGS